VAPRGDDPTNGPLIVGLGGAFRPGSATEMALTAALKAAEALGARTRLLGADLLIRLPIFDPRSGPADPAQAELLEAVRSADGLIVATPGYHGSLSGMIKNALDTLELTREDPQPYFQGRPVGLIVTADGWQATGTALMSLRAIVHAMRGWPTPLGAALNVTGGLFDDQGVCRAPRDTWQIEQVAREVMEFARMKRTAS